MDIHNSNYHNQMISVDVSLFAFIGGKLHVLLAKRSIPPHEGMWSLVGGGVYKTETCEQAVERELNEKLGISSITPFLAGVFSQPNRDVRFRNISVSYYCLVNASTLTYHINPSKVSEVKWFDISLLPHHHFAFDHEQILKHSLTLLQSKLFDIATIKPYLPQTFTLVELQKMYESALGTPLDKRNFRRKILSLEVLVETGEKNQSDPRKKAALYRFV